MRKYLNKCPKTSSNAKKEFLVCQFDTWAPRAVSVSMRTAVWALMWVQPTILAPERGLSSLALFLRAMIPGISCSKVSGLVNNSIYPFSFFGGLTWKCLGKKVQTALVIGPPDHVFFTKKGSNETEMISLDRPALQSRSRAGRRKPVRFAGRRSPWSCLPSKKNNALPIEKTTTP